MARARASRPAGVGPLSPRRTWRAITIATLLLVPSYWSVLAGLVSVASDSPDAPPAGPFIAFGLALIPFVFIVLAFTSEHPRAPAAVLKAMGLAIVVGLPVSALAADAVTGLVAAVGAGGIAALRGREDAWKGRAVAVLAVSAYVFVMIRLAGDVTLLLAPTLPFTCLGVADHLAERRREQAEERQAAESP
ncbi:MAG TPA: hypothetical protein VE522_00190 [Actinomycetota bacterium]|jgi:hypothetical protein|nr:hypothetical protein [Actinomycetota bacterium]